MADVKWIKIVTDIFDDEKVLLIESLPIADAVIVIWFKLLCLAGKNNNHGVFLMNDKIAYTDEMLAAIFRRDLNTIRTALKTFEQFGMIEIINNVITIPNWDKHQTLDSYEKKKERDRIYQSERREKQKLLAIGEKSSDTSSDQSSDVAVSEEEKEVDIYNNSSSKDEINNIIDEIWKVYPNKKGKADAIKKIPKILKTISKDELIKSIERYKKDVEYQRNNGFKTLNYANGSTFFNGRYMDYLEDSEGKEEIPTYKPIEGDFDYWRGEI